MIQIFLRLVVVDLRLKGIRFMGFRVVDLVVDCMVDVDAGSMGALGCFYLEKIDFRRDYGSKAPTVNYT
jgi:hypothetical protein